MEYLIQTKPDHLFYLLEKILKDYYENIIYEKDKYLMAIGEITICLLAHVDTVFDDAMITKEKELFYDREKQVLFCPDGAGFDDKAGIYSIIKIIQQGYKPHILFTNGEERGGIGATAFANNFTTPNVEIKYFIELDRQGSNDCVFYDCGNSVFHKYVESFGFETKNGSYSDISFIAPIWDVAAVNLSIGYYNEHSYSEYLNLKHMHNTIDKVCYMLSSAADIETSFGFMPVKKENYFSLIKPKKCNNCGKEYSLTNLLDISLDENKNELVCLECLSKFYEWCEGCGKFFNITNVKNEMGICDDCAKRISQIL